MFVRGFDQFASVGWGFAGFTFTGFAVADFAVQTFPVVGKRDSGLALKLALQPLSCLVALFFHARQLFLSFLG
jgi:hypothetical protein